MDLDGGGGRRGVVRLLAGLRSRRRDTGGRPVVLLLLLGRRRTAARGLRALGHGLALSCVMFFCLLENSSPVDIQGVVGVDGLVALRHKHGLVEVVGLLAPAGGQLGGKLLHLLALREGLEGLGGVGGFGLPFFGFVLEGGIQVPVERLLLLGEALVVAALSAIG